MTYKPSKELIEQIVAEQRAMKPKIFRSSCNSKQLAEKIVERASEISTITSFLEYPTINKALELYENKPQWQDNPDKEGWWWVCSEEPTSGAKFNRIVEIRGIPAGLRVWVGGFPTIEQYIGEYVRETKITWLRIPEPESYKGEE